MTNKEKQIRETESIASLKELEEYDLVKINSNGEFLLREV